ncbi:MAG: hypothetical protein QW607_09170 [Desulfurococcaceae archaeon]
MSYSPDFTLYLTNTLWHPIARADICIRNRYSSSLSVTMKYRNFEITSYGDIQTVTVPANSARCYPIPHASILPPGENLIWAESTISGTNIVTNNAILYYTREYAPNYLTTTDNYRIYGFAKFTYWGGVYRLSYIPRARDLDFLYVENMAGEFDILTREEMESNVVPTLTKSARILTLEYRFNSLEHLDRFLYSFAGHIADRYVILDDMEITERIEFMIPVASYIMKPLNIMSVELPQDYTTNPRLIFKFVFTGGAPLLALVGAGIFALGLLGGVVLTKVLSKSSTADVSLIYNTRDISNNLLRAQTQQLNTLIDSLDPALFRVSKEIVKAEINKISEQAIQENTRIADLHATNLAGRQVGISLRDKLLYAGVGAGAGVLAYLLLLRGGVK